MFKRTMLIISLAIWAGFTGCWGSSNNSNNSGNGDPTTTQNFMYDSVQLVAPVFAPAAREINRVPTWYSGTVIGEVYQMLCQYSYPASEGIVDMHNIYKVIYTAGSYYSKAESMCSSITEKQVSAPFNMGITDTYNCAGSDGTMSDEYATGFAIKNDGTKKYGLMTYRWCPASNTVDGHYEHGLLQGKYDTATGDLDIQMIHLVNYTTGGFVVRSHVKGNDKTHAFELRMITSSVNPNSQWTSIVGKGISKGAGNYFIFKLRNSSGSANDNYFEIQATATEADLQALNTASPNGIPGTSLSDPQGYRTAVDAMTFFTNGDVPQSLSDLGGTILLSY